MIARKKGYPIKIVLPENVSIERRQLLEIFGAEIILSPGARGLQRRRARAEHLADEHPDWAFLYQYANEANPRAHYEGTGPEILRDVPDITHFVAGLGTSGTLMGVGRYLKEQNPDDQGLRRRAARSASGSRVCATSTRATSRRCSRSGAASSCSTASASCGPVSPSSGPASSCEIGIFSGISAGAALAGAAKVAERDRVGHHRVRRVRRRLEVPLDRRLDRRPRRRRRARREDHLLLDRPRQVPRMDQLRGDTRPRRPTRSR